MVNLKRIYRLRFRIRSMWTFPHVDWLMLCSHLMSAFASISPSKFNIVSMVTQMQTQDIGSDPILCINVCVAIDTMSKVDGDVNANVKCKHASTWSHSWAHPLRWWHRCRWFSVSRSCSLSADRPPRPVAARTWKRIRKCRPWVQAAYPKCTRDHFVFLAELNNSGVAYGMGMNFCRYNKMVFLTTKYSSKCSFCHQKCPCTNQRPFE